MKHLWILWGLLVWVLPLSACSGKEKEAPSTNPSQPVTPEQPEQPEPMLSYTMTISANGKSLTATMAANTSTAALKKILETAPVTIEMHDYGNFEKVGSLGHDLPRNDEEIDTTPGDIILYQGNQICLYYDRNSWNFTRLGHIEQATRESMKAFLGEGNVTVMLSL